MKKVFKRCLLILLAVLVMLLIVSKVNHSIKCKKEAVQLKQYGVGNCVSIDDHHINVSINTAQNQDNTSKLKLVYMAGLGMGDAQISTRPFLNQLNEDNDVIVIDRPGNGLSEDTNRERTAEAIVQEYRQVLAEEKQQAPYVLIAHSVAGIYATYWAQEYPEEIKAIVYLDADPAACYVKVGKVGLSTLMISKIEQIASTMGLQRFIVSARALIGDDTEDIFSEVDNKIKLMLMYQNTFSKATYSEIKSSYENAKIVMSQPLPEKVPKLYIKADNIHGIYYNEIYSQQLNRRFDGDERKIMEYIHKKEAEMEEKINFAKEYGNITIDVISGPHCLYEYAPDKAAEAVNKFFTDMNLTKKQE